MIRTSNRRWLALSSVTALTAATALIGAPAARADPPGTERTGRQGAPVWRDGGHQGNSSAVQKE